jgi:predicted small lipoprotein YifL
MSMARLVRTFVTPLVLLAAVTGCGDRGPSMAERAAAAQAAQEAADAKAREESRAKLEAQRLASLWRYQDATVGGGAQKTAAIFATEDVDADGKGPRPVQLIFRDHEKWGRSGYLVLQAGDFACRPRCTVTVTADDQAPRTLAAWRPDTDEAIALFVTDHAALWTLADAATRLQIEFPVRAGGTRRASFEVASLETAKMPGW